MNFVTLPKKAVLHLPLIHFFLSASILKSTQISLNAPQASPFSTQHIFFNIRRVLIKNKLASCHFPALDM